MTLDFYQQFLQALYNGATVLATVVETTGSVPREVGAKLVICADGRIIHTIGGGAGEAKVIQHAQTLLQTGGKQTIEIDLSGSPQRETQGVCGGRMRVWLERWEGEWAIAVIRQILATLTAGQFCTLVMPWDLDQTPYLLFADAPTPEQAYIDVLPPPPLLLIVGAGHCGIQLAKVAHLIGFEIAVQDDRPDWANASHYPQATLIFNTAIAEVSDQLAHHPQLYAALVTRGYLYDCAALQTLLNRQHPCRYIGMIGSHKRVRQVWQAIAENAPCHPQTVYAPIGLDIGALTPEEIAVSISAELILVRRGGTGRPLSSLHPLG